MVARTPFHLHRIAPLLVLALARSGAVVASLNSAAAAAPAAPSCLVAPVISTPSTPLHVTDEAFASWTVDPSRNRLFFNVNFNDARLQYLASQIGGQVLRFGGGGGDLLTYASPMVGGACGPLPVNEECLNSTTLDSLLSLSTAASMSLVVALNIQPVVGKLSGPWDAGNARSLLTYLRDHHTPIPLGLQLGNECNSRGFTPAEQAAAFHVLAGLVDEVFTSGSARPKLIGPDADGAGPLSRNASLARLCAYLQAFVADTNDLGLAAVTHHEYSELNATTVLDPSQLDATAVNAAAVVAAVRASNATVPVWTDESAAHTGDSPAGSMVADCDNNGLCGRFGSVLWYADALGAKARAGIALFARQDLVGGSYALVNTSTPSGSLYGDFTPSTDYYFLWVWQRTVGARVLAVTLPAAPRTVRVYAFCARSAPGDVALVLINLDAEPVCVAAPSFTHPGSNLTHYTFTAGDAAGVQSWTARLNGVLLTLGAGGKLPPLPGASGPAAAGIALPPRSSSIVVVPASLPACA